MPMLMVFNYKNRKYAWPLRVGVSEIEMEKQVIAAENDSKSVLNKDDVRILNTIGITCKENKRYEVVEFELVYDGLDNVKPGEQLWDCIINQWGKVVSVLCDELGGSISMKFPGCACVLTYTRTGKLDTEDIIPRLTKNKVVI